MNDFCSNIAENGGGDFGPVQVQQPIYSQTPRLKASQKSPMIMYHPEPVKRSNSFFEQNFLPGHDIGQDAIFRHHTVDELDVLNPGFDNFDGAVSLPDLGGISVDFANVEDYQRLAEYGMNIVDDIPYQDVALLGNSRNRSQTFHMKANWDN